MIRSLLSVFRFCYLFIKSGKYSYARACWSLVGAFNNDIIRSVKVVKGSIIYDDCILPVTKMNLLGNNLSKLAYFKKVFTIQNHADGLLFTHRTRPALRLIVRIPDNIGVIEEVFIHQLYRFEGVASCVVLDVGMNVGYAAIAFAEKQEVKHVFGFELVSETDKWAEENFVLNTHVNQKITHFPYGLDIDEKELEIPRAYTGAVGASATEFVIHDQQKKYSWNTLTTKVTVKDICTEIDKIKDSYKGVPLVVKLDCEGAEYGLIEKLHQQKRITDFSILMIEWHIKGPEPLLEILAINGYRSFAFDYPGEFRYGFIYAVKNGKD